MRLFIEFVDDDWQVVEPGRDMPLGYFTPRDGSDDAIARARRKAEMFLRDYEAWHAAGAEPLCRPASNHPRYR
jgi:hypothetical protein